MLKNIFSGLICAALLLLVSMIGCSADDGTNIKPGGHSNIKDEEEVVSETPTQKEDVLKAFPGAEGFGMQTTGGRGGKVLFVTNLNDSGEGSFRAAINESGPRYILFKVSGTIALKSRVAINNGDLTIAGQTAPGDGICIKDYPVVINADNVIIRFMRFRMGDAAAQQADALESRFHKNLIIDHCSMSWSTDETATFYANENTTLQWSFITESLKNSVHEKGSHGYGGIWGGTKASFHHNLLAHHDSRNPRLGEAGGDIMALTDLVDLRNNVIYNWQGNSCYGGEGMNVNIVNCYYKPGPATTKVDRIVAIDKNLDESTPIYNIWGKYYIDGNYMAGSALATEDNWTYGVFKHFNSKYGTVTDAEKNAIRMSLPHDIEDNVVTHSAADAYQKVLDYSGASFKRDAVDARIAEEVAQGTYTFEGSNGGTNGIIDTPSDVGGWPVLESEAAPIDSSGDGMPDDWKEEMKLEVAANNPNGKDLSNVYDNIEVYINSLVNELIEKQK
ncbi:pectate lyase family protein [Robertkochia solimangrovi]|uniref:pectate lyase family protein n=1 Tax=Robertkochia solimangrovi TaxID=2213046 RepID=UPI00117C3156|nr:pectate lyase [Robertkochia solimangrovi]TRZ43697.1 pectate lyase [Robertkochia solimangrovi]